MTPSTQLPRLLGNTYSDAKPRQKMVKPMPRPSRLPQQTPAPKGAISMLQEYVQCSQTFHLPSNYSVLQWEFDSQMADAATLEFRALVAFHLEGVPHHVAGAFKPKKRDAQRDAAERALSLFVGRWSEHLVSTRQSSPPSENTASPPHGAAAMDEEELLRECCRDLDVCGTTPPSWSVRWDSDACCATVEMTLLGVPHQFAGTARRSEAEARRDAARRVLWYLQRPGFEDVFEPDPLAAGIVTSKIPRPPAAWAGSTAEGALEVAERKTAIMRVQNRLQQQFELRPGLSAWSWNYEMDPDNEEWPVLCRATVSIPVVNKIFTGDWVRGQRDAQLDTLTQVTSFLDELEQSVDRLPSQLL